MAGANAQCGCHYSKFQWRLSSPFCRFWDGIYVLYDYTAPRKASQAVQKYLSTPIVGAEFNILRHMTFNR